MFQNTEVIHTSDRSETDQSRQNRITSTVLVVDDENDIRKGLALILRKEGLITVEAENGRKALEMVSESMPDIILLDLMMPEVNGLEVCKSLKNNERTRLIPIIMITAVHEQEEKLKAIHAGADDFLNKPINISELRARVRSLLRMKHLNDMLDRSDTVIASLANAIEAKDKYTEGHNDRVAKYAVELAQILGLSEKDREIVRMAGILHDIGKIGVPDSILNKKGPLTPEEFDKVKTHPEHGERILKPLLSLNEVRNVVLYHHERFDGAGYPSGLKGTDIPIHARIIAIADSFDAMTTDRPYRKAFTVQETILEFEKNAGKMWDPELVRDFIGFISQNEKQTCFPYRGSINA